LISPDEIIDNDVESSRSKPVLLVDKHLKLVHEIRKVHKFLGVELTTSVVGDGGLTCTVPRALFEVQLARKFFKKEGKIATHVVPTNSS
jgi:hypothetical protein